MKELQSVIEAITAGIVVGMWATTGSPSRNQTGKVDTMNAMNDTEKQRRTYGSGRARLLGTLMAALVILLLAVGQVGAAAGNKPQTPRFLTPLNGSTVEDQVLVMVFAPSFVGYDAEFGVDGGNWQPMKDNGDGAFELLWNSGYASNGKHTLTARFSLGLGRPPVAAVSIQVAVQNPLIDAPPNVQAGTLTPPCIHVLRPSPWQDSCAIRLPAFSLTG